MRLRGRSSLTAAIEVAVAVSCILVYIWRFREAYSLSWIPIALGLLISHAVRRETPAAIGFGPAGWREAARKMAPWVAVLIAVLVGVGLWFETIRPASFERRLWNLARYLPWGVVQQYLLNGYFLNRLQVVFGAGKERRTLAVTVLLFTGAHAPNPFLMAVAAAGGWICGRLYLRYRNLFVLGLAHGLVGFTLHLVTPLWLSRGFYAGPRYFEFY